jgi:hypothetical protein
VEVEVEEEEQEEQEEVELEESRKESSYSQWHLHTERTIPTTDVVEATKRDEAVEEEEEEAVEVEVEVVVTLEEEGHAKPSTRTQPPLHPRSSSNEP